MKDPQLHVTVIQNDVMLKVVWKGENDEAQSIMFKVPADEMLDTIEKARRHYANQTAKDETKSL